MKPIYKAMVFEKKDKKFDSAKKVKEDSKKDSALDKAAKSSTMRKVYGKAK